LTLSRRAATGAACFAAVVSPPRRYAFRHAYAPAFAVFFRHVCRFYAIDAASAFSLAIF